MNSSPVAPRPVRPAAPRATARSVARRRVTAARVRGILLLTFAAAALALTVASAVLAVTWVAPVVAAALAAGTLGWGVVDAKQHRAKVAAERAARRAARPRPAPVAHVNSSVPVPAAPVAVEPVEAEPEPVAAPVRRRPRGELFDFEAAVPSHAVPAGATAVTAQEAAPLAEEAAAPVELPAPPEITESEVAEPGTEGWEPVPVPRPTYTMKARATRREVPVEELPFDGNAMLLDVEDEELPAVYKVV